MIILFRDWISESEAKKEFELSDLEFRMIVSAGLIASRDRGLFKIRPLRERLYFRPDLDQGKRTYREKGAAIIAKEALTKELQVQVPRRLGQLFLAGVGLGIYSLRRGFSPEVDETETLVESEFPSGKAKIIGLTTFIEKDKTTIEQIAEKAKVHPQAVGWAAKELEISSASALRIWRFTQKSQKFSNLVEIVPVS